MVQRTVEVGLIATVAGYLSGMARAKSATGDFGNTAQTTGGLVRDMATKVGGSLTNMGNQVGGTLGQILSAVGQDIDNISSKSAHLASALEVGGGIAVAAGIGLQQLGSSSVQATDQLNQAIKTAGESPEKYADQINKAVAAGENFDYSAEDTKSALEKLIPATGSTQKALALMGTVTNLAAQQHISLSSAATETARILAGSSARVLQQYGITMQKAVNPTKALASAQAGVTAAGVTLATAQKRLADLQDVDNAKKVLTISDHIALANAQDAVTAASGKLSTAQDKLAGTSTVVITKTQAGQNALDVLSQKLNGQASAAVDNFGSQFDIAKTKVEDWVKEISGPAGQVLTGLGPAAVVAGAALDIYNTRLQINQARLTAAAAASTVATAATVAQTEAQGEFLITDEATIAALVEGNVAFATSADGVTVAIAGQAAASTAAVGATDAEATAMVGLDGAMDANPIGLVVLALGGLVALVGGSLLLQGTQANTKATADFTQALKDNTGATNDNIRAVATEALLKDGALQQGLKLGLSAKTLVDASLGVASATKTVNAVIADQTAQLTAQTNGISDSANGAVRMTQAQRDAAKAIDTVKDSVTSVNQQYKDQSASQKLYEDGVKGIGSSSGTASSQVGALADEMARLGRVSPAGSTITISGQLRKPIRTGGYIEHGDVGHFASGGGYQFRGPGTGTSDSIPAMVSNGEYINTAATVARLGVNFFQGLNRGGAPATYQSAPSVTMAAGPTIYVSVPISASLIGNEDFLAKTITTSVQKGLKSGVIPAGWNG